MTGGQGAVTDRALALSAIVAQLKEMLQEGEFVRGLRACTSLYYAAGGHAELRGLAEAAFARHRAREDAAFARYLRVWDGWYDN
jgi:hypothetical protein